MTHRLPVLFSLLLIIGAAGAVSAHAQATRTWVSGVGDDVSPCSRTAPCKTFAGAISKTAGGGEIKCLDAGGFGAVSITKSITIDCKGTFGSILAAGAVTAVTINATGAVVRLRGLQINGAGTGQNGVKLVAADKVFIENSIIDGFISHGIALENPAKVRLFISGSSVRNNAGPGVGGSGTGEALVWISSTQLAGNGTGIQASSKSTYWLTANSITFNINGLATQKGGKIVSFRDNAVEGNDTNGSPTGFVALQ